MTTGVVLCTPFFNTVTVEVAPVVVIAELGSSNTPLALFVITLTSAVMPSFTEAGGFVREIETL